MTKHQQPALTWRGQVPVADAFDDPYYSLEDGLAETRHVFLGGNQLPERFRPGFHIAELGFGTGLNVFAALALWKELGPGGALIVTTFERHPMPVADMHRALSAWPDILSVAEPVLELLADNDTSIATPDLALNVVVGDARETLPKWDGQADAWFLDGFAPARNPQLWEPALMAAVAARTAPGGTAATYSAAGDVRRGLESAGFRVERVPGFARKRHMTVATLK